MNLSLPRDLEEFVQSEVARGQYPDVNALVADALREFRAKGGEGSEEMCPPELKTILLDAVNGPHHPMPANYFDKLRERIRGSRTT